MAKPENTSAEKQDNYKTMLVQTRPLFLSCDQEAMIRKFDLQQDESFLYLRFCGRDYRIGRRDGIAWWTEDGSAWVEAGYNDSMTLYDILGYSKPGCRLSGDYAPSSSLKGIVYTGMNAGSAMGPNKTAEFFDANFDRLAAACEALGGATEGKGDLAYRLPLFDFLPIRFCFWRADEDFPPEIRILWDTNVLSFLHFETLFFAAGHLLRRLEEEIRKKTAE